MEREIRSALGTTKLTSITGSSGGGCISSGMAYHIDTGQIFVKVNERENAKRMFEGEYESLIHIRHTKTVRVPKPLKVVSVPGTSLAGLIMEYTPMSSFRSSSQQTKLGEQLARMHLHNSTQQDKALKMESNVKSSELDDPEELGPYEKFGFVIPTSCGYYSLNNEWQSDWTIFYIRQRLQPLIDQIVEKENEHELIKIWNPCLPIITKYLDALKVQNIKPALLHGDLWSGNVASYENNPIIFDPASFYGHNEFDFGIMHMFGGFSQHFFDAYHKIIPKSKNFAELADIYELFHHLNHWFHFGSSYKGGAIRLMKKISKY